MSGAGALRDKLAESGLEVSDATMVKLLKRAKEVMEVRGRSLTDNELVEVARDFVRAG